MMLVILLAYGVLAFFHIKTLVKKKHWRDLVVSSIFLAAALTLTLLNEAGVKLPSPMREAARLFDALHLKMDVK